VRTVQVSAAQRTPRMNTSNRLLSITSQQLIQHQTSQLFTLDITNDHLMTQRENYVTTCANDKVAVDVLGSCEQPDSLSVAAAAAAAGATDDEMTGSVSASQKYMHDDMHKYSHTIHYT